MKVTSYLSPFNEHPDVVAQLHFSKNLSLCDCTLRDGEQQAGVVFTKEDKVAIAVKLDQMGIPEIEAGMPTNSQEDEEAVIEIVKRCKKSKITALVRAKEEDVDFVAAHGVWGATLSLPVGDLQRKHKLKWDDDTYIANMRKFTEYAKKKGLYVNLSPYDTTRANPVFLERLLKEVIACGTVDRIRLVDTVGSASPEAIGYMVSFMKGILGDKVALEIHCHDDFGLGAASTIKGAACGADVLSTTINGLGERAGNTATEEVLVALKLLYGVDLGVDLTQLCEVSEMVERLGNAPLQKHKAVVGKHAFSHETGMTVAGILEEPFVAEAYAPELVGQKREILIGKKSGVKSIQAKLKARGIDLSEEKGRDLLTDVKNKAVELKRSLSDEEFFALAGQYTL